MGITITQRGSYARTEAYLKRLKRAQLLSILDKYGAMGQGVLASATPVDTGLSSASWTYEIKRGAGSYSITWKNSNNVAGKPIVILLQYGHGTGTGGYVPPRDFINPAIRPIFEQMADAAWREVTRL